MDDYPIKGFVISEVSNEFLMDRDFRGGTNFSFTGKRNFSGPKTTNTGEIIATTGGHGMVMNNFSGTNPLGQAAGQTGASIADIVFLYNKSGSSLPILEWEQLPEVKAALQALVKSGKSAVDIYNNGGSIPMTPDPNYDPIPPAPNAEFEVWGMSPITLGLVSLLGVVAVSAGIYFGVKAFKNKSVLKTATTLG